MAKCTECRKAEALDTPWERITRWFFYHMFPKNIIELSQEKYTQGVGDGYTRGFSHAKESNTNITAQ